MFPSAAPWRFNGFWTTVEPRWVKQSKSGFDGPFAVSLYKPCVLRLAWINLWDKYVQPRSPQAHTEHVSRRRSLMFRSLYGISWFILFFFHCRVCSFSSSSCNSSNSPESQQHSFQFVHLSEEKAGWMQVWQFFIRLYRSRKCNPPPQLVLSSVSHQRLITAVPLIMRVLSSKASPSPHPFTIVTMNGRVNDLCSCAWYPLDGECVKDTAVITLSFYHDQQILCKQWIFLTNSLCARLCFDTQLSRNNLDIVLSHFIGFVFL